MKSKHHSFLKVVNVSYVAGVIREGEGGGLGSEKKGEKKKGLSLASSPPPPITPALSSHILGPAFFISTFSVRKCSHVSRQ